MGTVIVGPVREGGRGVPLAPARELDPGLCYARATICIRTPSWLCVVFPCLVTVRNGDLLCPVLYRYFV